MPINGYKRVFRLVSVLSDKIFTLNKLLKILLLKNLKENFGCN